MQVRSLAGQTLALSYAEAVAGILNSSLEIAVVLEVFEYVS